MTHPMHASSALCLALLSGAGLFGCGSSGTTAQSDLNLSGGGAPVQDTAARTGCMWNLGSDTPAGDAPTKNNSADLSGSALGTHAFDPTTQQRTVPLTLSSSWPGLGADTAYLTRLTPTDETAYLTVPVTNTGTTTPCFVSTVTYQWLDANGSVLNTSMLQYLNGSVQKVTTTNTDTCLAPGETGYLIDIELAAGSAPLYSAVVSITLGLTSTATGTDPGAKLVPSKLEEGTCPATTASRTFRLTATASGAEVAIGSSGNTMTLAPMVYLDSAGHPAGWTYLTQSQPTNVKPGSSSPFYDDVYFGLAVTRARPFLQFQAPDTTLGTLSEEMAVVEGTRVERVRRWQIANELLASRITAGAAIGAAQP